MKKSVLFIFVAVFVAALLLGFTWQANAQATRIEGLTSYEYDCGIPETFNPTFSGNVMHIRDYVHVNVNESDSSYLAGINTTVADAEFNNVSGTASIRGTMRLEPTDYPGSAWVGRWVFVASKGTYFGRAVAQGTGELEGMTLFMDLYDWAADPDVAAAVCEGYGVPEESHTVTEGYIVVSSRK
jgi:hypothetical protein